MSMPFSGLCQLQLMEYVTVLLMLVSVLVLIMLESVLVCICWSQQSLTSACIDAWLVYEFLERLMLLKVILSDVSPSLAP